MPERTAKIADAVPGDEVSGLWPREQLIKMNERFCKRVERALLEERTIDMRGLITKSVDRRNGLKA